MILIGLTQINNELVYFKLYFILPLEIGRCFLFDTLLSCVLFVCLNFNNVSPVFVCKKIFFTLYHYQTITKVICFYGFE